MKEITLKKLSHYIDGKFDEAYANTKVSGVSKDTRTLEKNNLYVPLRGENFDGHDFLQEAIDSGASASLWDEGLEAPKVDFPLIFVKDTLRAYQDLAMAYRNDMGYKIIGITGSNGKTSTKDILRAVLSTRYKVQATRENLNNEIGVPQTIFEFDSDTQVGIIEMGTESFGEIKILSEIARPNITMITNVGPSHLDKLKTVEGVGREKIDIVKGMDENGIFIYNLDDEVLSSEWKKSDSAFKSLTFGKDPKSNFIIDKVETHKDHTSFTINGLMLNIPLLGDHQAYNAAAACAVAESLGLSFEDVKEGLKNIELTSHRAEIKNLKGFDVLDDSYKSNPSSLKSALELFYSLQGYDKKIAVLGDMLDLGDEIENIHKSLYEVINFDELDALYLYGPYMGLAYKKIKDLRPDFRAWHFQDKKDLAKDLNSQVRRNSLVFIKGSRSMKMEEIIEALQGVDVSE